jgi:hypothetical protein
MRVVRDAGEQPAQFHRSRQLAALFEGGADCCGLSLGYDEHAGSMVTRAVTGKRHYGREPASAADRAGGGRGDTTLLPAP